MDRRYIEAKRNLITGKLRKELSDFRSVKRNDRNLPYISGSSISFGLTNDGIAPRGITKPFRRAGLCKQPIIPRAPYQLFTSDSFVTPRLLVSTPQPHNYECRTLSLPYLASQSSQSSQSQGKCFQRQSTTSLLLCIKGDSSIFISIYKYIHAGLVQKCNHFYHLHLSVNITLNM